MAGRHTTAAYCCVGALGRILGPPETDDFCGDCASYPWTVRVSRDILDLQRAACGDPLAYGLRSAFRAIRNRRPIDGLARRRGYLQRD